jgi:polysaccharide biosynthesis protein PslH
MRSLRIIMAMVEPPLPFGSAAARVYYGMLKALVERGHRVSAFATCSNPVEIAMAQEMFPASRYRLRCYCHPERRGVRAKWDTLRQPFSFMFSNEMRTDLYHELQSGYDVLHLEQLMSGWLGLENTDRSLVSVHFLSAVDLDDYRPASMRERVQRLLLMKTERRMLRNYKYFRTLSSRLVDPIRKINSSADITSVPIGMDLSPYPFIPDHRRSSDPVVSLIGSMGWHPTHTAAVRLLTRLYPEIKRREPATRFQIVGWSACSVLQQYIGLPDVEIFENVPDTRPFFENASVLLYAPSRASGVKIKVAEAMAFGVPVVTTTDGVEGLAARDGIDVNIVDDDAGLVDRTVRLLRSKKLQDRQRRAAREMLETACTPRVAVQGLEKIYGRMIGLPQLELAEARRIA